MLNRSMPTGREHSRKNQKKLDMFGVLVNYNTATPSSAAARAMNQFEI
jgi:hypothetical protein